MISELIICVLLLTGSTMMLLASIGVVRFPDTLCRAHALTKATTFGSSILLVALWISLSDEIVGLKILLIISFCMLTIPLSSQLVASLYYRYLYPLDKEKQPEAAPKDLLSEPEADTPQAPSGESAMDGRES